MSMTLLNPTGKRHRLEMFGNSRNEESIASAQTEELSVESYDRNSTKCIRITDNSMDPDTGMLNVRLVKSLNHLCQPAEGRNTKCCALHRYATGRHIRGQLLRCEIVTYSCAAPVLEFFTKKEILQKSSDRSKETWLSTIKASEIVIYLINFSLKHLIYVKHFFT